MGGEQGSVPGALACSSLLSSTGDPGSMKDSGECEESGLGVMLWFRVPEQSSEHVDVHATWYLCFLTLSKWCLPSVDCREEANLITWSPELWKNSRGWERSLGLRTE